MKSADVTTTEHIHIWDPSGGVRFIVDQHHWMQPLVCRTCGHTIFENADPPASLDDVSPEEWIGSTKPLPALQVNPASSAVAPWHPDLTTRVREVMEGEGLTERYVDVLLRGHTVLDVGLLLPPEPPDPWMCARHDGFLTYYREEWDFHLRDYHPRQWAQRQIDLNQE